MAKNDALKQTRDFLGNTQSSLTYGPEVIEEFLSGLPASVQTAIRREGSGAITTAANPILPMLIAVGDKNGYRLEFTMLINPENMNHGKTQAVNISYTRKGYVTQFWGPNQDILTATGRSAAFMLPGIGLTNLMRNRSFAYQNFMALVSAYKNNGYQFLDPADVQDRVTRVVNLIQGVEIIYDNDIFMGHFNNFTLDEATDHPFVFNYNFEFTVSALSNNYTDVRGHFMALPKRPGDKPGSTEQQIIEDRARLLTEAKDLNAYIEARTSLQNLQQTRLQEEISRVSQRIDDVTNFLEHAAAPENFRDEETRQRVEAEFQAKEAELDSLFVQLDRVQQELDSIVV